MKPNTMYMPSIPAARADPEKIKAHLQACHRNVNGTVLALSLAAMAFGLVWLAWILWATLSLDVGGLSMSLFTEMTPAPDMPGGGPANTIAGSPLLVGTATLIGTPLGVLAGIYLAEYGEMSTLTSATRFINDILLSVPSIVVGPFIYAVVVARAQYLSGIAGVITLVLLQIPIVVRAAENMLNLVPNAMCEAATAPDASKWKMTLSITPKVPYIGMVIGVLLATVYIAGETASLPFTALNNQFWSLDLDQSVTTLPAVIFKFATSPSPEQRQLARAGVFLVTLGVLGLSILARALFTKK